MKISYKYSFLWLLLGPLMAILISISGWYVYNSFTPDKLTGIPEMIGVYPKGLFMSLLTPWGWLMYGGLYLLNTHRLRPGFICTVIGAVILGLFWPIWATFLVTT